MSCSSPLVLSVMGFAAILFSGCAHVADSGSTGQKAVADFASCAKPMYPMESLKAEHEGAVALGFLISANGAVLDSRVDKSSGYPSLDASAHDAIKLCKFKPAIKDGKAVQDWTHVQYVWTLK